MSDHRLILDGDQLAIACDAGPHARCQAVDEDHHTGPLHYCRVVDWWDYDATDDEHEEMRGRLSIPVDVAWDGDTPRVTLGGAA